MTQSICLRRGPRDGEIHDVLMATPHVLMAGNFEERRLTGYNEYGIAVYSYPTVVYKRVGWDGQEDLPLYEYDRTEPA